MKFKAAIAGLLVAASVAVGSNSHAHVSVYVAGQSGVAVNAAGATYAVSLAPGHGCTGPRTKANPAGAYDTTSMEVFMPRTSTGAFIFPEVRIVNSPHYRATLKWVIDPTNANAKRVSSIMFDKFVLPAVNNGYAARDTMFMTFTVKLPTLAAISAAGYTLASGATTGATGATIYLPSKQYCDVTGLGVGVQAASSTHAALTDTVDPDCVSADTIVTQLVDDWTTTGNTPSLTIGTATTTVFTIAGNAPTAAAAATEYYCKRANFDVAPDRSWTGDFGAKVTGTGKSARLTVDIDDKSTMRGHTFTIRDAQGNLVAKGRANTSGDARIIVKATSVTKGQVLALYFQNRLLGTDAA
jgi:hypothetical protein